jgi:hypothetical protein
MPLPLHTHESLRLFGAVISHSHCMMHDSRQMEVHAAPPALREGVQPSLHEHERDRGSTKRLSERNSRRVGRWGEEFMVFAVVQNC